VAPDSELDLSGARAPGLELEARFTSPDASKRLVAPKADLRDASITIALTSDAKRPGPKAAWPTAAFAGAKTNKATRIEYAPLAGAAPAKVSTAALPEPPKRVIVDPGGPSAPVLGRIDASNAGLWLLVADAKVAAAWRGDEDEDEDEDDSDFARAERASETGKRTIRVGDGHGVIVEDIGEHGYAFAYAIDDGVALLELGAVEDDFDESIGWKKLAKIHGAHVVQLAAKRRSKVGEVTVTSGALALLLPYAKLRKRGEDQLVLPLPNGTYAIFKERFADPPLTDEHGTYVGRVQIVRAKATVRAKPTGKSSTGAAKSAKPSKTHTVTGALYLELIEGTSRKFWEATVEGRDITVRFGRIGTDGQRVTKSFASPAAAVAERDKLVAQKRRKGYG
jgi:predicted DNA-binding WGR domain protein